MADCGASGTTLDRVARVVTGGGGGGGDAAVKQIASLMGHATVGGGGGGAVRAMPVSAPNHLVLPGSIMPEETKANATMTAAINNNRAAALIGPPSDGSSLPLQYPSSLSHVPIHHNHRHFLPAENHLAPPVHSQHLHLNHQLQQPRHHNNPAAAAMQLQQLQLQQQMIMNVTHQQQQLMQQQLMQQQTLLHNQKQQQEINQLDRVKQNQLQQQQGQDFETAQNLTDQEVVASNDAATTSVGNEGIAQGATIEELASAWAEADADTTAAANEGYWGHEGVADGATMEELAAAWAEAEADYSQVEAATNLWSGGADLLEGEKPQYDFFHKEIPEDVAQQNWMEQGIRHFEAGNLKDAIHAFEMELQHNNADNATAWRMLGRCHAENDQDREAIVCLEQAVDRDPYSPEALLALGVSYVNELNHERALASLKAWITHNPNFAGLECADDDVYGAARTNPESAEESAFDEVQRLLLRALDFQAANNDSAADVLEALGVVYNVSRDYDAAVDSFKRAIDARSDDYQLWNKLGATLANSNQSDKALSAYHQALQLKPKYARAWLNMAISHSNLHNYDEAARCYLQTLSLNRSAIHCWSYLRIALSCLERWDLIPNAASQDLAAFREHFDFVIYGD